jgi:hypothetical protein
MATEVQAPSDSGLAALLKGIVNDIGDLVKQEFQFAKAEIKSDVRKTKEATGLLACGVGLAALGVIFLALMIVYLLHWLTSPAGADPASLPLWGCYAIVGGLFLVGGGALVIAGKKKFDSFNPLPEQTAATVKENVQWITNSK